MRAVSATSGLARSGRWQWLALLGVVVAEGVALRLSTLGNRSFWLDETTAVRQATWSIPHMLGEMANNVHPPLFHILLHYWIVAFGRSELAVRAFPLVWGIAAIPLLYWVGSSIYDRRVGFIAASIGAFSPFFVWYSQEARMYSMMFVLALLATGALYHALRTGAFRWWSLFTLATAAGVMTQYFFLFLVAGQGAYFLLSHLPERERELKAARAVLEGSRTWVAGRRLAHVAGMGTALLVAAAPLSWWLPQVLEHRELLRGVSGAFNYGGPAPTFGVHFNELVLVPVQYVFGFHADLAMRDLVAIWPLLITGAFLSAGIAQRLSRRTWYLVAAGVGGSLLIALLGLWQPILEARYFTATAAPLVILAARFLAELRADTFRTVAAVLLVVSLAGWVDQSYNPDSIVKWDNREAMDVVSTGYRPGDTILLIPNFVTSIPEYYLPTEVYAEVRKLPAFDANGRPRNRPEQLDEDLERMVGVSRRVWIVATWQESPRIALDRRLTSEWLADQGFELAEDHRLRRIRVSLFETSEPRGFFYGEEGPP